VAWAGDFRIFAEISVIYFPSSRKQLFVAPRHKTFAKRLDAAEASTARHKTNALGSDYTILWHLGNWQSLFFLLPGNKKAPGGDIVDAKFKWEECNIFRDYSL
jgi:hypothetical protein